MHVGDLVTVTGPDGADREGVVWQIVAVRRGAARLEGRTLTLDGKRRWEPLDRLRRYAPPDDGA